MTILSKPIRHARRLAAGIALGLVMFGCGLPNLPAPTGPDVLDAQEVIALIPQSTSPITMTTQAAARGFVLREDVVLDGLDLRMLRFTFPTPLSGKEAIDVLEGIEPDSTAGINHVYRIAADEGLASLDYAQSMMDWPVARCRSRMSVGVIDTSIDKVALRASGARIFTEEFLRGRAPSTSHGTEVVSVLVDGRRVADATVFGAAVVGRTALGEDVSGVDSILKALDWLAENDVTLVNMSLSGPYNKLLDEGVSQAVDGGMIIVAAVGNEGRSAQPRFPAAFDTVIAVTAVDANGTVFRDAVRGDHVEIAAPGVDILVELDGRPRFVTGTSIATPFVTARIMTDQSLEGLDLDAMRSTLTQLRTNIGGVDLLGPPRVCQS
jgi:subtilisin family serine protease